MSAADHLSGQQFYHGTATRLKPGAELTDAFSTTSLPGAGYYAALKAADTGRAYGHVYHVRPSDDITPDTSDPGVDDQYVSSRLTVVRKLHSVERGRFA